LSKSEFALEILAYLAGHPDAQDTLDGIVEWWLLEQKIGQQIARVKEALTWLVKEELILAFQGKDAKTHYCINKHKIGKIQALIESHFARQ
jgi:hypothetical protein